MKLSSTESEYVSLSECAQEVKFISIILGEMIEVEKPSVIYEDNKGAIFLAKKRQVDICTKHIDIFHHFLRDMVEENDDKYQCALYKYLPACFSLEKSRLGYPHK